MRPRHRIGCFACHHPVLCCGEENAINGGRRWIPLAEAGLGDGVVHGITVEAGEVKLLADLMRWIRVRRSSMGLLNLD